LTINIQSLVICRQNKRDCYYRGWKLTAIVAKVVTVKKSYPPTSMSFCDWFCPGEPAMDYFSRRNDKYVQDDQKDVILSCLLSDDSVVWLYVDRWTTLDVRKRTGRPVPRDES